MTFIRRVAAVIALIIVLLGGGLGTANANTYDQLATAICTQLTNNPTYTGLAAIGATLMANGATPEDAAALVVAAVLEYCPENLGVLQQVSS